MDFSLLNESSFSTSSYFIDCDKHSVFTTLWTVLTAICTILGLPATLLVLKELQNRLNRRVSNELFMISLTVADLCYLMVIPFSAIDYMTWNSVAFLYISNFTIAFTLSSRPLFMACTCVDCYFAVVHPITYKTSKKSGKIRMLTSSIAWVIILCFSSYKGSEKYPKQYAIYSAPLLVALPVIAFCDISILQALRKPGPTIKNKTHPQKKRAVHTVLNSFVVTLTTYLPPVVIFSFADVMPLQREIYYCKVFVIGYLFSMSGTCIMPFLYLDSVGKLHSLKKVLKKHIWK